MPSMTADELSKLDVTVPVDVAGRAFGLGRTKTRQMVQAGTFPCSVRRIGRRLIVLRADLLAALGVEAEQAGHDVALQPPEPSSAAPTAATQQVGRLQLTIDGRPFEVSGDSDQVTSLIETSIRERRHTKLQLDDRQADLIVNWPNVTTAVLGAASPETSRRPRST